MAETTPALNLNVDWLISLPPLKQRIFLDSLSDEDVVRLVQRWPFWARPFQKPPAGDWPLWLFLGGRGAGKTKAGAEWVNALAASGQAKHIGLIGETLHDARSVMVSGPAGLLSVWNVEARPHVFPSKRRLEWPSGAVAEWFSAEDPEQLRGPQFDLVWGDEFAKWRDGQAALDMAQFALRLGETPRMLLTTTPRRSAAMTQLIAEPGTTITRAVTGDNPLLPRWFMKRINGLYAGSRLGRQELMAEILADEPDALWQRGWIDAGRVRAAPDLARVVVAVDPPVTTGPRADACGIVVAGRDGGGGLFVLADRTVHGLSPQGWADAVGRAVRDFAANAIVVETNQGGDLVADLMRRAGAGTVPVKPVHAAASKRVRAEPVSLLYEQGRVHHVGSLPALEDEMCRFGASSGGGRSPDRVDALVWAVSDLAPPRPLVLPRARVV